MVSIQDRRHLSVECACESLNSLQHVKLRCLLQRPTRSTLIDASNLGRHLYSKVPRARRGTAVCALKTILWTGGTERTGFWFHMVDYLSTHPHVGSRVGRFSRGNDSACATSTSRTSPRLLPTRSTVFPNPTQGVSYGRFSADMVVPVVP